MAGYKPTKAEKAARQRGNELTAAYFAAAMLGLITVFVLVRFLSLGLRKLSKSSDRALVKRVDSGTRVLHGILLRRVPGFDNLGRFLLFVVYLAINVCLSFQGVKWTQGNLYNWAKRMGWMTASNLALVTFLALKNTPLAVLTKDSYEKLRPLHQIAGYSTVALMICHALTYLAADSYDGILNTIAEEPAIRMGPVAAVALLVIFFTATFMRRMQYETFYMIHTLMFMLVLIAVGMHRPHAATHTVWIIVFAAAIYVCDRAWRLLNFALNYGNNSATLTPLSHGRVRVVLKKPPVLRSVAPGRHAFLWIPKVRLFETHPFTISAVSPIEFVVQGHDGFTKDLVSYATANPGATVSASLDGPYGSMPNFSDYDRVILVAGGTGATFTFGVASELCSRTNGSVHFIWVVRHYSEIAWFASQLEQLRACPHARVEIYVTSTSGDSRMSFGEKGNMSKVLEEGAGSRDDSVDLEKSVPSSGSVSPPTDSSLPILPGRPDLPSLLRNAVSGAKENESVIIGTCGPQSLQQDSTRAARSLMMSTGGPKVDFYKESFGW